MEPTRKEVVEGISNAISRFLEHEFKYSNIRKMVETGIENGVRGFLEKHPEALSGCAPKEKK